MRKPVPDAPGFETERVEVGRAYPRNGNVHNPTPEYRWDLYLDGKLVDSAPRYRVLVKAAREYGREGYSTKGETAGDRRTEAEWIGDIAHRTLERLDALRPELATLARQFDLMRQWCYTQGLSAAAFNLERFSQHLDEIAGVGSTGTGNGDRVVHGIVAATGREKQSYHKA
jgi:hypothetical protein